MTEVVTEHAPRVLRRHIKVGPRRVHYLRGGSGLPVVLVHSSPASVRILLPEIHYLSRRFTCFAFDTPGFGLSDALPLAKMVVADLADALADNMRAVGLPPCPVYGSHTGAAIALELAARHPERVTGVVLDGLPVFTNEECASLLKGYFQTIGIDELGGHFSRVWTRFRDQSIWFPWFDRSPENFNPYDLALPARTHEWMMMYFYAAQTYMPAYRAALEYGQQALTAVDKLNVAAVFTATETDMLHPHLKRLPVLKTNQDICEIGTSIERKHSLIADSFERFGSLGNAPADKQVRQSSAQIDRQFVDLSYGQIHVRFAGNRNSPTILLLHDAPGSALFLEPLIEALGKYFYVCAPDLPGCGESDPLDVEQPTIADYAVVIKEFCEVVDLVNPVLYGIGFGSTLAIALATHSLRVAGLILRGVLLPDAADKDTLRHNYAPVIEVEQDGSHWYRTWLMLRDSQIYWPWYDSRKGAQRGVPADFSAERMHRWTFDVVKKHSSYHHLINAVIDYELAPTWASLSMPLAIIVDKSAPLSFYDEELETVLPKALRFAFSDEVSHANTIATHFRGN